MYRVRFFRVVAEHSEPDSADMLLATVSHAFRSIEIKHSIDSREVRHRTFD